MNRRSRENTEAPHIKVYRFREAPPALQALSTNGGDEDWLAIVPPGYGHVWWLEEGGRFGVCCVDVFDHPDLEGYTVHIGSHA